MSEFYAIERKLISNILNKPQAIEKKLEIKVAGNYPHPAGKVNIGLVILSSGMKRILFFSESGIMEQADLYVAEVQLYKEPS